MVANLDQMDHFLRDHTGRLTHFILDGHEVVAPGSYREYLEWMGANKYGRQEEDGPCRVGSTRLEGAWVSTVFLGLDHQFGDGPPLVFETLVFEGDLDGEMERYSTWDEAAAGHERMVERLRTHTSTHTS